MADKTPSNSGASKWMRIAGRRFRNTETGEELSRRQYDKRFGPLAFFGSYEKKAKHNAHVPGQLLRPARGRKAAPKNLRGEELNRELRKRETESTAHKAEKLAHRLEHRKPARTPKKWSIKNIRYGRSVRRFSVAFTREAIEAERLKAKESGLFFSYAVGIEYVSDSGHKTAVTVLKDRTIGTVFNQADFNYLVNYTGVSSHYKIKHIVGAWIGLRLKRENAERNGAKIPYGPVMGPDYKPQKSRKKPQRKSRNRGSRK